MAVGEHVRGLLAGAGLRLEPRADVPPPPRMPNLGERGTRPYQDAALIASDPAYGIVVCFCERVTAGEIRDAYASDLPPADLNGLRRRTRAMNGRCQGFYCGATVTRCVDLGGVPQEVVTRG
jgi:glycerol-3-phosphate dehydrogenase